MGPLNLLAVGRRRRPHRHRLHPRPRAVGSATRRSRRRTPTSPATSRGAAACATTRQTGASVAMQVLRRQAQSRRADRDRRGRADLPRASSSAECAARAPRRPASTLRGVRPPESGGRAAGGVRGRDVRPRLAWRATGWTCQIDGGPGCGPCRGEPARLVDVVHPGRLVSSHDTPTEDAEFSRRGSAHAASVRRSRGVPTAAAIACPTGAARRPAAREALRSSSSPPEPSPLDGRAAVHHDRQAAGRRDPRGLPVDDPELQPQAARPDRDGLLGVGHAQLGASEDVDHVDRAGRVDGLGERPEGRHARRIERSFGLTGTQS